jgi:carbonic anhydrase/acetyltransferase-like protein (isoleucine patch superfamily)
MILRVALVMLALVGCAPPRAADEQHIEPNVRTSFTPEVHRPALHHHDYVHPLAAVIGDVEVGDDVFVGPGASVRGDEGGPIHIGNGSNVQDGAVVHALETFDEGHVIEENVVRIQGRPYAVYIGENVSITHQAQVHGPASVGDNTFVGMQVLVFKASVGQNVVIEPGATIIGVTIADGRYVPAGSTITTQAQADDLPEITSDYAFATLNNGVLEVNHAFADAYGGGSGSHGGSTTAHTSSGHD